MTRFGADAILPFYEREAFTEFEQEVLHVVNKCFFELLLFVKREWRQTDKLYDVRVFNKCPYINSRCC